MSTARGGEVSMDWMEALAVEVRLEAASTRRVLERVPEASFSWRPHARSRTLGELATHVANLPGLFLAPLGEEGFDRATFRAAKGAREALLEGFDAHVAAGLATLAALDPERLAEPWCYRDGARVIFELPRLVVLRTTALNHLVHHRGQLTVYLRLLDVPVPPIYGPSADEG